MVNVAGVGQRVEARTCTGKNLFMEGTKVFNWSFNIMQMTESFCRALEEGQVIFLTF